MLDSLTPPFDFNRILANKRAIRRQLVDREGLLEKRIALLGGSTLGEIRTILELFLLDRGIQPVFYEGAYASYFEELAFPNPALSDFAPDIIYVHTTFRNLTQFPHPAMTPEEREDLLTSTYVGWKGMWEAAAERYGAVIIQNNFEMPPYRVMGNMEAVHPNGSLRFIEDLNGRLYQYQRETARFHIQDINYLSALAGLDSWHDEKNWYLYQYALGLPAIPLLCHSLSSMIKALYGLNRKALILDMDNTLWGGIIGDDGLTGIELGPETPQGRAFADFQAYAGALSDRGVLLGISSKNDEANALEGLNHPSSRLKREDFVSFRANWEPKHQNLEAISRELNIGIDSLVFADDNPAERQAVEGFLPQVEVLPLSALEPEASVRLLDRRGYFEMVSLSQDDINRKAAYRDNIEREAIQTSFQDYDHYLRSLEMVCHVDTVHAGNVERVTQLINKTNQFNLTTLRLNQAEVEYRASSPDYLMLCGRLVDRFGDNGLVLVLSARMEGRLAEMELFLMSCRVFKRNLEDVMLHEAALRLREAGVKKLKGLFLPTAKNGPAEDFYKEQGFTDLGQGIYELDLEAGRTCRDFAMEIIRDDA